MLSLTPFGYYSVPAHPFHRRHHRLNPVVSRSGIWPTSTYDGLMAEVLNEGFRGLQQLERELGHVGSIETPETTKEGGFKFTCSVAGYAPEEMSVELQGDEVVITGEHKAESEGQSIHRQFTRRVLLPGSVNRETIACNIDERGQLEVRAAGKALPPTPEKVNIPIGFKESATGGAVENGIAATEQQREKKE